MKTKFQFLIAFLFTILSSTYKVNAQNKNEWQPIFLNVIGDNKMDGVEVFFQVNSCNGEDAICIKFINHNKYTVKIEWFDEVFTHDLKWINKEKESDKKTITISSSTEKKGECFQNLYPELYVKAKTFLSDSKDFKRFKTDQLMVTAVK